MNPRVMIGVPTAEMARRADFYDYLNFMDKPDGTMMTTAHGQSPAKNRNEIIKNARNSNATHVLFIDDDMAVPKNGLNQLLQHDKDVVGGLYLLRNYPHFPLMFDEWYEDGRCRYAFLTPDKSGLQKVVNTELGFCLIKMEVFDKVETPDEPFITLGAYEKDGWCDDIHFFNKVRKAGVEIFVDLDVQVGHMMTAIITPGWDKDHWTTVYNTVSIEGFQVNQVSPTKEQLEAQMRAAGVIE